ncbi:hypothetical protein LF1_48450 [Rubripirellula obstinata]|uniref:Uncharacterized protein n=1 Tax=Rubripirellula obstinata TaxID=406547 RepID=A0A5B1CPJ2_9BACT|nr:hypothetical protein LF1_48450 [Rubripirellula obstinata]
MGRHDPGATHPAKGCHRSAAKLAGFAKHSWAQLRESLPNSELDSGQFLSGITRLRVWFSVLSAVELAHLLSILEASIANPIRT